MKKLSVTYTLLFIFLFPTISYIKSQQVVNHANSQGINDSYLYPWAGGMDAIQFCEVDMDMDGRKDLLAFDRRGNRKMCFVNNGTPNKIDFEYAPQYSTLLPDFYEWVIFKDYNMDGKNDIFTYSPGYGSMMVYKNISDEILKFELIVYPYLTTQYPGGYVNLFVTSADYPGIADVDNDGDLDILTFGVLGSFVDMHKNMSMEKYGIPDSLDYEHSTYCWGHFAESDESNVLFFDTCVPGSNYPEPNLIKNDRHTGSTLLLEDIDDNGLVDLLLGDVDYPGLFALYNTGSVDDAYLSYADTLFPQGTSRVKLFSMPFAAYIDVNNDDVKDLVVSPFDPGIITSRNKNSSWLYTNSGTDSNPEFILHQTNFLQEYMIDVGSGAYPIVFDWDGDGLSDLFIGSYGKYQYSYYINYFLYSVYYSGITYYKNIGTIQKPVFQLWDDDFAGLKSLGKTGLIPAFDDIDGDGSPDLLIGTSEGNIIYVKYNPQENNFEIIDENYLNIDVGEFSSPQLFDLNKDGVKDLIIGEKDGVINYYQNLGGVGNPQFEYVTDSLGKINVTDYNISWDGYSTPSFFRENDGTTGLVIGSEQGKVFYFTDIDNNIEGEYTESSKLNILLDTTDVNFDRGMRSGAVICDLFTDGNLEMIVGNYSGGLEYFNGDVEVNTNIDSFSTMSSLNIYPNPSSNEVVIELDERPTSMSIDVYNVLGELMRSNVINDQNLRVLVDISDIENGAYFIVTTVGNTVYKNKLIVIK